MPPTKQSQAEIQVYRNMERIENVEEEIDEFKKDMKLYMERMDDCVSKLTNHYSQRPSWPVALLVTGLVGLCVYLAQYCITHQGEEYESLRNAQQQSQKTETGQKEAFGSP